MRGWDVLVNLIRNRPEVTCNEAYPVAIRSGVRYTLETFRRGMWRDVRRHAREAGVPLPNRGRRPQQ